MKQILNRVLLNRCIYSTFSDSKKFKSHKKLANMKCMMEEKDKKILQFFKFKMQMKGAVQDYGSTKPDSNLKLAQIIEQAKKENMSTASIKSFLEKMEPPKKIQEGIIEIRGPSSYIMLVRYLTNNMKQLQSDLNSRIKKCSGSITDSSARNMFTHTGIITVEKKDTLEQATEDAIDIGAEDVEEFEENDKKYFQFKCDPQLSFKIRNLLERRQYCVLSTVEDYMPQTIIKLNESDLEAVSRIHEKILSLEDIIDMYDNIE